MNTLPKKVFLREEGPREGFQSLQKTVSTKEKLQLIHLLSQTGIQSIEVTSFVRPDRVPQHADAEHVAHQLLPKSGVRYRALYLNEKGLTRAAAFPSLDLEGVILLSPSEEFLKNNNALTLDEALARIDLWLPLFQKNHMLLERLMISTAFGSDKEKIPPKQVLRLLERAISKLQEHNTTLPEITFADTSGWATPKSINYLIQATKDRWPEIEIGLHLHDSRGSGMANVYAGLLNGVTRFDCSVGGFGGCPFLKDSAGNVPTEDVAFLCEQMDIQTGVDLPAYIACAQLAEKIAGFPLPGKLKNTGL